MSGRQTRISQSDYVQLSGNFAVDPTGNRIAYVEDPPNYSPYFSGPTPALMIAGIRGSRISGPRKVNTGSSELIQLHDGIGTLAWRSKQEVVASVTTNTTTGQQIPTSNGEDPAASEGCQSRARDYQCYHQRGAPNIRLLGVRIIRSKRIS